MEQFENAMAKRENVEPKLDETFYKALKIAVETGKMSVTLLMRKLGIGFSRASRIIDQMEKCGYIGESNGSKPREVFVTEEELKKIIGKMNIE